MFYNSLAALFRATNSKLLYVSNTVLEKMLKIIFLASSIIYKGWIRKDRPPQWRTLTIDKTLKMKVDISKAMGAAFYWMGFHELNEWRFLHRYLTPEMVLIDIGANQGEFTIFSAKRLWAGKVYAFEPVNDYFEQLNHNVALNHFRNVKTFPFGLSDIQGNLPVYMAATGPGENEGLASIYQSGHRDRFVQEIRLELFDSFAKSLTLERMDFIKIDVEGAELNVLKGSRKMIEKFKPAIMLEISNETYKSAGYSVDDVLTFFKTLNYSFYLIGKGGKLMPPKSIPAFCNAVFLPTSADQ
jgi:FkbM family methyltransferase